MHLSTSRACRPSIGYDSMEGGARDPSLSEYKRISRPVAPSSRGKDFSGALCYRVAYRRPSVGLAARAAVRSTSSEAEDGQPAAHAAAGRDLSRTRRTLRLSGA